MAWGLGEINSFSRPSQYRPGQARPGALWSGVGMASWFKLHTPPQFPDSISCPGPSTHTHTHTYTLKSACFPLGPEHQGLSLSNPAATCTICGLGSTHTGLPSPIENHSTVTLGTNSGRSPARWVATKIQGRSRERKKKLIDRPTDECVQNK